MEKNRLVYKQKRRSRLDNFLACQEDVHSRSHALKIIKNGSVKVNDKTQEKGGVLLSEGDTVEYQTELVKELRIQGEDLPLDIIFENEDLLVINKPAGQVVHPGAGNIRGTLASGIINYLGKVPKGLDPIRPGIVHRLDKDTSGLLVIAKNAKTHAYLSELFKSRKVKKTYKALVYGKIERGGEIESLIGRHKKERKKMAVTDAESRGKRAITTYSINRIYALKDRNLYCTLLSVRIKTGRTHQIRVHMKEIGHPVVGDKKYAGRKMIKMYPSSPRQLLHAFRLEFELPDGKEMNFTSPLPEDFKSYLEDLI